MNVIGGLIVGFSITGIFAGVTIGLIWLAHNGYVVHLMVGGGIIVGCLISLNVILMPPGGYSE